MNIIQFENGVKYFQTSDRGLFRFNKEHEIDIYSSQGILSFTEDVQTVEMQISENKLSHYERDGEIVSLQEYNDLKNICDSNRNDIDYQIRWMRFSHNIKPVHQSIQCWLSKGFNYNKIPHSEYPEIEALFTYSGDLSKPTYAILKLDKLVSLAKQTFLDNGFRPTSAYSYSSDDKANRYTFSIDDSFQYAKVNGGYIDKYALKNFNGDFIGEYTQCVSRLNDFKATLKKIIYDVNLKESKRVLSLGEATRYYNKISNIKKELNEFQNSKQPRSKLGPILNGLYQMAADLEEYITKNEKSELESDTTDESE